MRAIWRSTGRCATNESSTIWLFGRAKRTAPATGAKWSAIICKAIDYRSVAPAAVRRCLAVIRSEAFADAGPRAGIGVQFPDHPEIEGRRRNPNAVIVRKAQLNRSLAPRMTRKSASSRNNGKLAPTQSSGARQSPADGRGSLAWYSKSNPTAFQAVSFSSRAGRMEGWRSTHISAHATYNCKIPRHLAYEIFVQILRERIAERARPIRQVCQRGMWWSYDGQYRRITSTCCYRHPRI